MKLVVQRVKRASVLVQNTKKVAGSIDKGLFVLVGVGKNDTKEGASQMAAKLSKLRVMADAGQKMNLSTKDSNGAFLVVSQFTLLGDTKGGNRPSFVNAAEPTKAKEIYEHLVDELKKLGEKVEIGSFGDYMEISTELDGPVTIIFEI